MRCMVPQQDVLLHNSSEFLGLDTFLGERMKVM